VTNNRGLTASTSQNIDHPSTKAVMSDPEDDDKIGSPSSVLSEKSGLVLSDVSLSPFNEKSDLSDDSVAGTSSDWLTNVLKRADELRSLYPPSHPSLNVNGILGPHSSASTWSEVPSSLPSDDTVAQFVQDTDLVVFPYMQTPPSSDNEDDDVRRRRGRAKRSTTQLEVRVMAAGAFALVGIAIAVYTTHGSNGAKWKNLLNRTQSFIRETVFDTW